MRQETVNIYQFAELSEQAKKKAIEHSRDTNVCFGWWECIYDQFKEDNPQYEDCEISFSGFSSQGDGASFTFRLDSAYFEKWIYSLDIPEWKKAILTHYTPSFVGRRHNYNYYHEYSVTIDLTWEEHNRTNIDEFKNEMYPDFLAILRDEFRGHCKELYRTLEQEYNYLTSDESIIEFIEANEYEFTEDGEFF